ncbi:MAG: serine/threonine protein kinase [Lentisphaerae bacterium]|nr:serine/threonine protein kinase [Lentisphaerota bacterium]
MNVIFECTGCGISLEADYQGPGAKAVCPSCGATVAVPLPRPGPGSVLGGFQVIREIGAGGMGTVYLARQLSMERDVALKVLAPELTADPQDVERFLNEVRVSARFDHPNIVSAYEAGRHEGHYYMAMAFVDGVSLEDRLRRGEPLPEKEALPIVRKVAAALAYAWDAHKTLHRDIKPGNVLLTSRGEPKLTDMGLSHIASALQADPSGFVIGTPNYMSPEQLRDMSATCVQSDMYSLGATLYHMLTGQIPFAESAAAESFRLTAGAQLPDPRLKNRDISKGCVDLLEIMLARKSSHRHRTWAALIADVDRVLAGKRPAAALPKPGASLLKRGIVTAAHSRTRSIRVDHDKLEALHGRTAPIARVDAASAPRPAAVRAPQRKAPSFAPAIIVAVAIATVAGIVLLAGRMQQAGRDRTAAAARRKAGAAKAAQARAAYAAAIAYKADHPYEYEETVRMLEKARAIGIGTAYDEEARLEIIRVNKQKTADLAAAREEISRNASRLVAANRSEEAAAYLRGYGGPFAAETRSERLIQAERHERAIAQRRADEAERAARAADDARTRLEEVTARIGRDLLNGNFAAAEAALARVDAGSMGPVAGEWATVGAHAAGALKMPALILDSFRGNVGQTVPVALKSFSGDLRIYALEGGTVVARRVIAGRPSEAVRFTVDDLSPREKLARLGDGKSPELNIMRAIAANESKAYAEALNYLAEAACPLARAMADGIRPPASDGVMIQF